MAFRTKRTLQLALGAGLATFIIAGTAASQGHPAGVELVTQLPPFEGEADFDDIEVGGVDVDGGGEEDTEENIGIAGYYLFDLSPGVWLGPRAMYVGFEGDESNSDYSTFDGSAMFRYVFDTAKVLPFIQAGAGLTYATVDFGDDDGEGFGWHISGGGGCGFHLSDSIALYAALLLHRQAVRIEADTDIGDYEADLVITRGLTTVGIGF